MASESITDRKEELCCNIFKSILKLNCMHCAHVILRMYSISLAFLMLVSLVVAPLVMTSDVHFEVTDIIRNSVTATFHNIVENVGNAYNNGEVFSNGIM